MRLGLQTPGLKHPVVPKDHLVVVIACGRKAHTSDRSCIEVRLLKEGALAAGFSTELWTAPRIAQLIETKFAVKLVPTSVWRLLGRLGWSVQRPTGQARERDERAVRTWKAKRWPELKKSLRDKAE